MQLDAASGVDIKFDMNSWYGITIVLILCIAIVASLIIIMRFIKKVNIKTKNLELSSNELSVNQELMMNKLRLASDRMELLARESIRKQISYMKTTVLSKEIFIRELMYDYFKITIDKDHYHYNMIWLIVEGLVKAIVNKLATNITDNHVGNTDLELSNYSRLRAKEYAAFVIWYIGDKKWIAPTMNLIEPLLNQKKDIETYIYEELFKMFKGCKCFGDSVKIDSMSLIELNER